MTSKRLWIINSLILAALLLTTWTVQAQRSTAPKTVWEYKIIPGPINESKLNEAGTEGWELVAVEAGGTAYSVYYLKRPKQ